MHIRRVFLAVVVVAGLVVVSHSVAFAQGTPLFAVLLGGNEVSNAGEAAVGDPNGFGSATVILFADKVCFGITFSGIGIPSAAHIHEQIAGQNGSIVVHFLGGQAGGQVDPPTTTPGAFSGCVEGTAIPDPTVLTRIRNNPSRFYVFRTYHDVDRNRDSVYTFSRAPRRNKAQIGT